MLKLKAKSFRFK